jgi:hypothetical protein
VVVERVFWVEKNVIPNWVLPPHRCTTKHAHKQKPAYPTEHSALLGTSSRGQRWKPDTRTHISREKTWKPTAKKKRERHTGTGVIAMGWNPTMPHIMLDGNSQTSTGTVQYSSIPAQALLFIPSTCLYVCLR